MSTAIPIGCMNSHSYISYIGYTVHVPEHWVFEGTGLKKGDAFGGNIEHDKPILNGEVDAVLFDPTQDPLKVTNEGIKQGTPENFVILCSAILYGWSTSDGKLPRATMGIFQKGNGIVFKCSYLELDFWSFVWAQYSYTNYYEYLE